MAKILQFGTIGIRVVDICGRDDHGWVVAADKGYNVICDCCQPITLEEVSFCKERGISKLLVGRRYGTQKFDAELNVLIKHGHAILPEIEEISAEQVSILDACFIRYSGFSEERFGIGVLSLS